MHINYATDVKTHFRDVKVIKQKINGDHLTYEHLTYIKVYKYIHFKLCELEKK